MREADPVYRRILLKLSGEVLMGEKSFGIDPAVLKRIASEIVSVWKMGVQIGVVIGGGNIFRGLEAASFGFSRVRADHIGMLATIMNAMALGEALKEADGHVRVMTAIDMTKIAEPYDRERAVHHLKKNRIVLVGGGTGNPYFTTDTAAALRAVEIDAQVLLKATRVDGVYEKDPRKYPDARRLARLTYKDVLKKTLMVMDLTAVSLSMDQSLPIIVFDLREKDNIKRIVCGEDIGTLITGEKS